MKRYLWLTGLLAVLSAGSARAEWKTEEDIVDSMFRLRAAYQTQELSPQEFVRQVHELNEYLEQARKVDDKVWVGVTPPPTSAEQLAVATLPATLTQDDMANLTLNAPQVVPSYHLRGITEELQQILAGDLAAVQNMLVGYSLLDRQQLREALRSNGNDAAAIQELDQALDSAQFDEVQRLGRQFSIAPKVLQSLVLDSARLRLRKLLLHGESASELDVLRSRLDNYLQKSPLNGPDRSAISPRITSLARTAELLEAIRKPTVSRSPTWPAAGRQAVPTLFSHQIPTGRVMVLPGAGLVAGIHENLSPWVGQATPQQAMLAGLPRASATYMARTNNEFKDKLGKSQIRLVNVTEALVAFTFKGELYVQHPNSAVLFDTADAGFAHIELQLVPGADPVKYRLNAGKTFQFYRREANRHVQFAATQSYRYRLQIDNRRNPVPFRYAVNGKAQEVAAGEMDVIDHATPPTIAYDTNGGQSAHTLVQSGLGSLTKEQKDIINTTRLVVAHSGERWILVNSVNEAFVRDAVSPRAEAGELEPLHTVAARDMGTVESEVVARIEKPKEEPIATAINPKLPVSENLDELPNLYILAVGVSEFQHESIQDLQFADVDAVEFEETWRRQEGVRFHRIHSRVLINEAATKREIERGLGWIEKEATSKDLAIVMFSSHGIIDSKNRYYLATHDMVPGQLKSTCVSRSSITSSVQELASNISLVFFDTCHAGAALNGEVVKTLTTPQELAIEGKGVVTFFSSLPSQVSYEHPEWKHGAFTRAFLDAVGHSGSTDSNRNGYLELSELNYALAEGVKRLTNSNQHTTMQKDDSVEDNISILRFLD